MFKQHYCVTVTSGRRRLASLTFQAGPRFDPHELTQALRVMLENACPVDWRGPKARIIHRTHPNRRSPCDSSSRKGR